MSSPKTIPNNNDVDAFINAVTPEWKQEDTRKIVQLMSEITGKPPVMWGNSIIGFGTYHYKYASGREGDWFLSGLSPRKQNMTVYIVGGFESQESLLQKLGKHKKSVGCLYFKKLSDIDIHVLEELIKASIDVVNKRYDAYN